MIQRTLYALILALAALAIGALLGRHHVDPFDAHPRVVRDSVQASWGAQIVKHDTFRIFLRTASADTLRAILRDRARRPPLFIHDTIQADTMTTEGDAGSPGPCEVALSCQEARRLVLRDSASMLLIDSLRGAVVISQAERDSLDAACQPRTPWSAAGIGFAAGLAVCAVLL
jgi:hypothetical protein